MFTEQGKRTVTAEEQESLQKAPLDVSEDKTDDRASEDVRVDYGSSGFLAGLCNLELDWVPCQDNVHF